MYRSDKNLDLPFKTSLHNLLLQKKFKEQFNHKLYNELFIIKRGDDFEDDN
jgi:type I restriction enzyme R subunit